MKTLNIYLNLIILDDLNHFAIGISLGNIQHCVESVENGRSVIYLGNRVRSKLIKWKVSQVLKSFEIRILNIWGLMAKE